MSVPEETNSEELTKITEDIQALSERLKAQAEKAKQLSTETEHLLKKAAQKSEGDAVGGVDQS